MANVEQTIEVNLPVRTVYNQWTQFEEFPRFMQGVEEVRQLDDTRLHWRASIAGKTEEWDAVITDQIPDQQVGWRSTSGSENSGVIRFTPIGADRTRVTAVIGYEPEGSSSRSATSWVSSRAASRETWSGSRSSSSHAGARPAWRGEIQAELSRAARATSSPLSSPSSQLSWNQDDRQTVWRSSPSCLRLPGRAPATAPPPDGDECARLQDLDEADAQGQEQQPLRAPDHRRADADQDQPEDRQAEALDPVQHVDSLPEQRCCHHGRRGGHATRASVQGRSP